MKPSQSIGQLSPIKNQRGMLLVEALCAILIFSFGVLGLIGLQVAAVSQSGDAKLRNAAAQLADAYINQISISGRTPGTINTAFNPSGTSYNAWLGDTSTAGTVMGTLPGVTATVNTPSVKVACGATTLVCTVNIVMQWQSPKDALAHTYATDAQISLN